VVVAKSFYITFVIHIEQFALVPTSMHLRIGLTVKLVFWGALANAWVAYLWSHVLFVYYVIKQIVDRAPKRYLHARTLLRLWLPKASKVISSC